MFILLYFVLDGVGRRWTMAAAQGALGLSCIMLAVLPKDMSTAILIVYIIGKVFLNNLFNFNLTALVMFISHGTGPN